MQPVQVLRQVYFIEKCSIAMQCSVLRSQAMCVL